MERVLANWHAAYYLQPVAALCALFACYRLILTTSELKFRSIFLCYAITVAHLFVLGDITIYHEVNFFNSIKVIEIMNLTFALIEAYVFYTFYISIIENRHIKRALRILSLATYAVIISGIVYLLNSGYTLEIGQYLDIVFTIDLAFLIFPGIWYFYELSSQKNVYQFKIILLSLCFTAYCLLSVPFYSILDWLKTIHTPGYNLLFALHYLCIAAVCLTLSAYPSRSYRLRLSFSKIRTGKFISFVHLQ